MPITDDFSSLSNNADLSTHASFDKVWYGSSIAGQISGDNRSGNMGIDYTQYAWDGSGHTAIGYRRNDGTFPDDQYAELEFITGDSRPGPAVRMNDPGAADGGDGYSGCWFSGLAAIYDWVGGSRTELSRALPSTTFPRTIKLDVSGEDLELFDNGSSRVGPTTDSGGHSAGNPGIAGDGGHGGNAEYDDFECSDTTTSAGGIVVPRHLRTATRVMLTR